jgi:DNA-directed RNA polymerase subunit RPC12/RpoP
MLQLEEYEAIRLIDYEGLIHEQAAAKMQVSRPTFTRIYEQARKKLATALVEGRSFLIEGGEIELSGVHYLCEECQHKFIRETEEQQANTCPDCGSERIMSLSECFIKGCKRCTRCR